MTEQNNQKRRFADDILPLAIGEAIVSVLTVLLCYLLSLTGRIIFDYRIILGALLGAAAVLLNHIFLIIKVDKEISKYFERRGDSEMSEEDEKRFAKENATIVQNSIRTSSMIRNVTMFAVLVLAFLLNVFNPIATAIPMFAFRPIISVAEMIKSKNNKTPDPSKFIKYDDDEENKEKEED